MQSHYYFPATDFAAPASLSLAIGAASSAEPVVRAWPEAVNKAGNHPDAVLKD